MTVTVAEQQLIALQQVAADMDADDRAFAASILDPIWELAWLHSAIHPDLPRLYAVRELARSLLPRYRRKVDMQQLQGVSLKMSQQRAALETMIATAQAEIQRIEQRARVSRGGAVRQPGQRPPWIGQRDRFVPPVAYPTVTDPIDPGLLRVLRGPVSDPNNPLDLDVYEEGCRL